MMYGIQDKMLSVYENPMTTEKNSNATHKAREVKIR